ncbi:MAG: class I SAM-dependent methyltransferase [Candidatus Hodarchaeota archaeon]
MDSNKIIDLLKPERHHRVLEIGFGKGKLLKKLSPLVKQVSGIDVDERKVNRAIWKLGLKNLDLRNARAENLPFDDSSFDAVVMVSSYHEFSDGPKALSEIWRVLKPLGRLLVIDISRDNFLIRLLAKLDKDELVRTFEEMRKEMLMAGFSDIIGERIRVKLIFGGMWLEGTKKED